jgi:hypothetical protein
MTMPVKKLTFQTRKIVGKCDPTLTKGKWFKICTVKPNIYIYISGRSLHLRTDGLGGLSEGLTIPQNLRPSIQKEKKFIMKQNVLYDRYMHDV